MSRIPGRPARFVRAAAASAALLLAASSCDDGGTPPSPVPPDSAGCTDPVRGSRYAVCGRLGTGTSTGGAVHTLTGTVDADTADVTSHYSIVGGTFHADR